MKYNRVCSEHGNLYTDWLCDTLQCEPCLRTGDKCVRFSVFLSISDQASCYQKHARSVSSSLSDTLDDQGKLNLSYEAYPQCCSGFTEMRHTF